VGAKIDMVMIRFIPIGIFFFTFGNLYFHMSLNEQAIAPGALGLVLIIFLIVFPWQKIV
jgi:hypothetical protein